MGAGKSSVSKVLAEKFEKSAVIKVDHILKMIIGGYIQPGREDFITQKALGIKNACMLAINFLESGFNVIVDDVVGKTNLKFYSGFLHDKGFKVFLLLPTVETMLKRFNERGGATKELEKRTKELHANFSLLKNHGDYMVIDSSNQTLKETADQIFDEIV